MLQLAQFSDLIKAYEMVITAKSSGLDLWEGIMLALFILKDVAIVGGILGTFIWYVKRNYINDVRTIYRFNRRTCFIEGS